MLCRPNHCTYLFTVTFLLIVAGLSVFVAHDNVVLYWRRRCLEVFGDSAGVILGHVVTDHPKPTQNDLKSQEFGG